ncbi:MAG: matrixin family metalloprotease [Gemmatimonadota bacterium]|nr:matrixin family metalloprotease [Gemmatimonadota bacterium]
MNDRAAPFASALCVLAFMAWLVIASGSERSEQAALPADARDPEGTALPGPCARPLSWHVADVDPRFDIDRGAVEVAAREAAAVWMDAAGKPVFRAEAGSGIPIRLIYDARQARTEERRLHEDRIRAEDSVLTRAAAALARSRDEYERARERYRAERSAVEAIVSTHNAVVRRWNDADGVPPDSAQALVQRERRVLRRRDALDSVARGLEAERAALLERERTLSARRSARNAEAARLREAFPLRSVEAGSYTEGMGGVVGSAGSRHREIRIFRFEDIDELTHVLAHELGHALGLGHLEEPGAVMSPKRNGDGGGPSLHPADREAFMARCGSTTSTVEGEPGADQDPSR